jgi:hypothetical protein
MIPLMFACMKTIRTPFFLFLVCLTIAVAGCSKSSSPTAPNNTTTTTGPMPTVGTTYIKTDNTSALTYDTVKVTAVIDSIHIGSTVRMITETNAINGGIDTMYESFLTNGDLALDGYSTGWGPAGKFLTLPFVSHTTVKDTFTLFDGVTIFYDTVVSVYSAGAPYRLNNQTYQTDSVTVTNNGGGGGVQYYYTFIPTLGLIASYGNSGSYSERVTSYSPK